MQVAEFVHPTKEFHLAGRREREDGKYGIAMVYF